MSLQDFPQTIGAALAQAARRSERGVSILDARGRAGPIRPYAELESAALTCAGRLRAAGVAKERPVLVCLPSSWEFLEHWFGAVLAGAWPVAIAPPGVMGTSEHQLRRIDDISEYLDAAPIICSEATLADAHELGLRRLSDQALLPEQIAAAEAPAGFRPHEPEPEEIAFLQLTSGSTGRSRAVMISHRAAVHNAWAIEDAIGAAFERPAAEIMESCSSWLPLHHDMGLVGSLLTCLRPAVTIYLMAPRTFLGRPNAWLASLGSHGISCAPAPNFAYQTCVERVNPKKLEGVDLSLWRAAMVGAEMIRPDTMAAFIETFAPLGFEASSLRPCFGMAEATLALTFDRRGGPRTRALPEEARAELGISEVIAVGEPVVDTEVRVCAPDGTPVQDGAIGEIRGRGPGIFAGYYRDAQETARCLVDGWLVTGDLGFFADGELCVTGRTKDLIIVHGTNVMPHEIEWAAEAASGGGGICRAGAFSVARGPEGEVPIVALEVGETDPAALGRLDHAIRVAVGHAIPTPLADLVLVRRGTLPKTTSGKVQRGELRRLYLSGELERLETAVGEE